MFFNVSGGPYGIEDAVPTLGPGVTLALLVLTPIFWSLPVALAMAELASAMPDEGGYVTWTRRAFGPYWAFLVGWWSWIDGFVDVAVYPALFVEYLRFWIPEMTGVERWLLVVAFIVALTGLNLAGVRPTGHAALALAVVSIAPAGALTVAALMGPWVAPWTPMAPAGQGLEALGLGLAVLMWNYSGWDTPSTILGETRAPERAFRSAMFLALPVLTAAYLLPSARPWRAARCRGTEWTTGTLPVIARSVGGPWLGHALAVGAVLSTAGLFMSLLLTNSRLPRTCWRAITRCPPGSGAVDPRSGTPWAAVLLSAACYAAFADRSPSRSLIVLNVWLYSLSLLVELAAFVWLRVTAPEMPRPWRVPGKLRGAIAVAVFPLLFCVGAIATAGWTNTIAGAAAALTGPLAYRVLGRRALVAGEGRA